LNFDILPSASILKPPATDSLAPFRLQHRSTATPQNRNPLRAPFPNYQISEFRSWTMAFHA